MRHSVLFGYVIPGFLKSRRDRKKEKEKEAKDIKKNNKKRDSDASRGSGKEKNGDKSDT